MDLTREFPEVRSQDARDHERDPDPEEERAVGEPPAQPPARHEGEQGRDRAQESQTVPIEPREVGPHGHGQDRPGRRHEDPPGQGADDPPADRHRSRSVHDRDPRGGTTPRPIIPRWIRMCQGTALDAYIVKTSGVVLLKSE